MNAARIELAAHRVHDPSNPRRGEPRTMDAPHPDGSCAWRAGRAGHEDRIGVARNRYTPNPLPEWWAWCGRCNWVPLGPGGEGMHRTWQEAQDAAAAHADWHLRINAAV